MKKIKITYDPINGHIVTDGRVQEWVEQVISSYKNEELPVYADVYCIGSELMIHALRAAIKTKKIKAEDVVVIFNGEELTFNEEAQLPYWPEGFCDTYEDLMIQITGWQMY